MIFNNNKLKFVARIASNHLLRGTKEFIILRDVYIVDDNRQIHPFRTHLWVDLGKEKRLKKYPIHIIMGFEAELCEYEKASGIIGEGLAKIRFITPLGVYKNQKNVEKLYNKLLKK